MTEYLPEGSLIDSPKNKAALQSIESLREAQKSGEILEARVIVCTAKHDLILDLGAIRGVIPRNEGAIGIESGETRDIAIISRVNKPVCFRITGFEQDKNGRTVAICSRKTVQEECTANYLDKLIPGDVIPAVVTHMESFGCFADIGCGISSLLPIDSISVSRISHPSDRFRSGQGIFAVVSGRDEAGRICLSHKELLGTWEENAANFAPGETVGGIIRSVEDYGVFVELAPNLAGLAESCSRLAPGMQASVYIKSLIPDKMKIKLIVVDAFEGESIPKEPEYYITKGHLDRWQYSPAGCSKNVATIFSR
ncbi:MAG: S1 RNA-binding domain-containing protein [Oscillospiraceae bacterium]|nr:S1 RNA-binding domain-containing protein [Oscillospiraceae bacterium]